MASSRAREAWRTFRYLHFGMTPWIGRKRRHKETSKARARREREGFFTAYCRGRGLDIGYGGDPVVEGVRGWDYEHGDAEALHGLEDESFDFVYSSHTLEHVEDCEVAIRNWWRVLRPGGHLILYLPHRDLYEKRQRLPSRFNPGHLRFFLPDRDEPPDTVGVEPLVRRCIPGAILVYCRTCDEGYRNPGASLPSEGEFSIEAVIRK